jgi:hypothetical protein
MDPAYIAGLILGALAIFGAAARLGGWWHR